METTETVTAVENIEQAVVELVNGNTGPLQGIVAALQTFVANYGLKVVGAIIILVIGRFAAKMLTKMLSKAMEKGGVDVTLRNFIEDLTYTGLIIFVVIAALGKLGMPITQFVAVLAAASFAIGLALQGSLANFSAGVMLIMFKPFKVGDFVELAGEIGTVKEIQIFNTIMDTVDNIRVICPNAKVTSDIIHNYTANGNRRVDLVVGVSYGDDLKKAKEVIEQVLAEDDNVLNTPAPQVAVSELADSCVNLVVRPWATSEKYWTVYFDITEKVKVALDKNGITIPFPQRDVHVVKEIPK